MAPDERDRSFDKALTRHLRSAAHAGEAVSTPAVPGSQAGVCPDSETLAAYHERSLFPAQLNSLKEHIIGCAHCQAILSQLEATDEISLQAAEREEAVAKQPEPVLVAQNLEGARAAEAAPHKKSRRVLLIRGARWQWLAPAGAIAASLLVWIALHENRSLAPPDLKQVQVATNQAPPPSAPPASRAAPEPSLSPKAAPAKPQSATDELASANARSASGALKSRSKQDYLAQASPSTPLADKERGLRKDAGRESPNELPRAEEKLDRDAKTADAAKLESAPAQAQLQTQAANVQSQNQSNANSRKPPGPAPLGQMEAKKMKAASAEPAPPSPQQGVAGGIASSYDDSVWSRQTSGVLADLLTGSAPSDQVCWIVGRAGAILLSTDGGAHWKLIHSPLSEDLGGVRATDTLHATIWNARNTRSFETNDGGLTWTPVPSP
jgi:hypothetical protein